MSEPRTEAIDFLCAIIGWPGSSPATQLLQALEKTGSINGAAQAVGMQYKSAWQKLDQISNLLPYPLLTKRAGGSGGGGSVLTEEGKKLLQRINALQRERSRFMQLFADGPQEAVNILKTLRRMEMQLSARNVWLGQVTKIEKGAVNSVVQIRLKGGDQIASMITDASVKRLELAPGKEVMAIVKASSVMLGVDIAPESISARNLLAGTVSCIIAGAVNDEITIELPGGSTVTAIITSASVKRLGLEVGKKISAIVKASDVLLAVA
ncbi:TOBE domain-containing protein [Candidatus Electronema sp. JC]|uniref:TOBE domain-containing protein n=1 Tax=Candidatus Electronema sp. JC TaxID=3401570 RepID=UPI003AA83C3B